MDLVCITGEWTTTGEVEEKRFLLKDNASDTDSRIIIFASDQMLELLGNATEWYMDGNFKLAPPQFQQLYVIRIIYGGVHVTAAYILLQDKKRSTYEEVFRILLEECRDRNIFPDPQHFYVDFKISVFLAIREIFGEDAKIQGCFYHLCQSTYRKVQELGLTEEYKQNKQLNKFCGMLDGLAFLPDGEVREGMQELKDIVPPNANDLIQYFDANYVSGKPKKVGKHSHTVMRMKRRPPLFPVKTWNVHDRTLEGLARTNNLTEGWNNRFGHIVNMKHPSIFHLIKKMRQELAADCTKLEQQDLGLVARKKKRTLAETKEVQLQNLCAQRATKQLTIIKFLRSVSEVIRFRNLD